jgi:hypothetical protein
VFQREQNDSGIPLAMSVLARRADQRLHLMLGQALLLVQRGMSVADRLPGGNRACLDPLESHAVMAIRVLAMLRRRGCAGQARA